MKINLKNNNWFEVNFSKRKFGIGIVFSLMSLIICMLFGGSIKAGILFAIMFVIIAPFRITLKGKYKVVYYIVWTVTSTFVMFFLTQMLLEQGMNMLSIWCITLNMICYAIIIGIIYMGTMHLRFSVLVNGIFWMIFATINYYVCEFRGVELAPIDLLSVKTAINVVKEYNFHINISMIYAWILFWIFVFASVSVEEIKVNRTIKYYLNLFLVEIILIIVMVCGTQKLYARHWYLEGTAKNGFLLNFALGFKELYVDEPDGYTDEMIDNYERVYTSESNADEKFPNIIVIMNESFSDASVLGTKIKSNQEIMPFIDSLDDNIIKGYALSSIYGGNTPNSEYEFLTGNTLAFLPKGFIPYQQHSDEDTYSLVSDIGKRETYKFIAMHPYYENGWSRETVYPNLGFEQSYFLDDFKQENLIRNFVSDQEMFEKIISEYESLEDNEKLFLFGVTMQNHGGYEYEGDNYEKTIELEGYSQEYSKAEQYLSVIHETEKAVEYLITYFESVDEDVVILFYGDHFPRLEEEFYEEVHGGSFDSLDEQQLKYKVPFFIWANYDIEEQYVECTSLNFLSNYLYEAAGMELPSYNLFLKDLQEVIPAMNVNGYYSLSKGKFLTYDEAEGEEAEWLEKYQILQYNSIFDEDNRSEVFFPN